MIIKEKGSVNIEIGKRPVNIEWEEGEYNHEDRIGT